MPAIFARKAYFDVRKGFDHKMLWMEGHVDQSAQFAYIGYMNIGTRLFTMLNGRRIGSDAAGNVYFEDRRGRPAGRPRRWVAYNGVVEPTRVPPEWHAWLHYTTSAPIPESARQPWQKPHHENLTGTPAGYRPPGHDYQGGNRAAATGDYEAWTPGS